MIRAAFILLAFLAPRPGASVPAVSASEVPARSVVEGTILGPGGRPMGGAEVILRWSTRVLPEYADQAAATCDAEGRFALAGLPAGIAEARLIAHVPGKSLATVSEGVPVDLRRGAPRLLAEVEPRSVLRVSFLTPAGLPAAEGALTMDKEERWVPFGGSRALLTGLPSGPFGIKYHSETYGGGVFFVDLPAGRSKDTVIALARPEWIEGKALDAQGRPAAGVLYRSGNAFRGMASRTGADGVFRLRRPGSGKVHLQFRDPRFRDTALSVGRDASGTALEVRLDPGVAPITGKVRPFDGNPEACLVEARPADIRKAGPGRARWQGGEVRRAAPGPGGDFLLAGLGTGTYRVRLECPGANLAEDTALPGSFLGPLRVGPARALEGRVIRKDGSPVTAFAFLASGIRPESPEAALRDGEPRSDSAGSFRLPVRHEGGTWVCASAPGLAAACQRAAAEDSGTALLELERGHVLRVRALAPGPGGEAVPLAGARVRMRKAGCRNSAWSGETDSAGLLAFADLGTAGYAVDVRADGRLPFRGMVELVSDTGIDATLPEGAALAGRLVGSDGRPPRGLRVLAMPAWPSGPACPPGIVEAALEVDGSFRLAGLGNCKVTLGAAAVRSRQAPFLPLWRADGLDPGPEAPVFPLPPPRTWEITPLSGGLPLPVEAEVHILLPPPAEGAPGEILGHSLGSSRFRGTYAVAAFAGVRYVAVVSARGYRERADTVVIPPGAEPFETRLELPAWPALVGRVAAPVTPSGAAGPAGPDGLDGLAGLAGLKVRGPMGAAAETDAEGRFRLEGLPPGPAELEVRDAEGRLLFSGQGRSGGEEERIPLADSLIGISGVVVDAADRPVSGAAVLLRRREAREGSERVFSDRLGRFLLRLPAGAWLACPEDPSLACTRVRPGSPTPAKVRAVQDTRNVTVTCKLPMPLPLPGGAVLLGPSGPRLPSEARDGDLLHPIATFRGIAPGPHEVHAAAYLPAIRPAAASSAAPPESSAAAPVPGPPRSAQEPAPATLWWASAAAEPRQRAVLDPPGPGVMVTARDPEGRALRGVGIRFLPRGVPAQTASQGRAWGEAEGWQPPAAVLAGTDADGSLLCLGVQPGRYWIYASHGSHAAAPLAWDLPKASAAAVTLTLAPGSPIRVKATYLGQIVSGARAEVFDSLGNRAALPASAGPGGDLLECGAFAPGRYHVAVAAPGMGRLVRMAEVSAGVEANLEAALPVSGWLEVVGEGLEDKVFYLKDANDRVVSLARQAEAPPYGHEGRPGGSLLFHGIVPERYQLWMEGGRRGLGEVEIRPAALTVVDVGRLERVRVSLPARRG